MPTLFNKQLLVCDLTGGSFGSNGVFVDGTASTRTVRGTAQALSTRDIYLNEGGSLVAGSIKIYSSEKLKSRERGKTGDRSFVLHDGIVFECIDHVHFSNNLINHEKYICSPVPKKEIPASVSEAFAL